MIAGKLGLKIEERKVELKLRLVKSEIVVCMLVKNTNMG
jgi:hypothetical protein